MAVSPISPLNLNEYLVLEINAQNKKGYVISLHQSRIQGKDEFDQFLLIFEQLISDRMSQNHHFIIVRSFSWWKNDLTTTEGN